MNEITQQLLICLTAAHFAGDFLLQSDKDASTKQRPSTLLKHAGIVAFLSYLLCGAWLRLEIPLAVLFTHAIIDYIKAISSKQGVHAFVIDQITHIGVIILIAIIVPMIGPVSTSWGQLLGEGYFKVLVLISGAIVTVYSGGILIGLAVKPFLDQLEQREIEVGRKSGRNIRPRGRGFENGGLVIGQLERALIFMFIIANQPAGIGFLIAAKSIFRFGEIKDQENRMEAEYIIIGTLMSFSYALLAAYVTKYLFKVV